jgi:hypothetical protein
MNKTATNTVRLFYRDADLKDFFESSQAKFWATHGAPFIKLSPEECKNSVVPHLGKFFADLGRS